MFYPKINTCFERDKKGRLLEDIWLPEYAGLQYEKWEIFEKINGTNLRITWENGKVSFGGRTEEAQLNAHVLNGLIEKFHTPEGYKTLDSYFGNTDEITIFGEGVGSKIGTDAKHYSAEGEFILFDIHSSVMKWAHEPALEEFSELFKLRRAPYLGSLNLIEAIDLVKGGFASKFGDFPAEGVVAHRYDCGKRVTTKLKTKDFVRAGSS